MGDHFLENMMKAEEALAKLQDGDKISEQPEMGIGEASRMSPDSPMVARLKEDRMRYEIAQQEAEQIAKKLQATKVRKAKRLNEVNSKQVVEAKERHLKAELQMISKVNSDLKDAQFLSGKLCAFIDSNEAMLNQRPYLKVKMQRIKRMMSAFYYGLKQASINPDKGDFLNDLDRK